MIEVARLKGDKIAKMKLNYQIIKNKFLLKSKNKHLIIKKIIHKYKKKQKIYFKIVQIS